ncbi:unnamed protein product [Amoebophrya sp. A25]|nr:unnamed protein product [Amoebophrya sp. A25]|eukprot:GSA25T00011447001.1
MSGETSNNKKIATLLRQETTRRLEEDPAFQQVDSIVVVIPSYWHKTWRSPSLQKHVEHTCTYWTRYLNSDISENKRVGVVVPYFRNLKSKKFLYWMSQDDFHSGWEGKSSFQAQRGYPSANLDLAREGKSISSYQVLDLVVERLRGHGDWTYKKSPEMAQLKHIEHKNNADLTYDMSQNERAVRNGDKQRRGQYSRPPSTAVKLAEDEEHELQRLFDINGKREHSMDFPPNHLVKTPLRHHTNEAANAPKAKRIFMAGHSGGCQLLQRWALYSQISEPTDSLPVHVHLSSCGSYGYLDHLRPLPSWKDVHCLPKTKYAQDCRAPLAREWADSQAYSDLQRTVPSPFRRNDYPAGDDYDYVRPDFIPDAFHRLSHEDHMEERGWKRDEESRLDEIERQMRIRQRKEKHDEGERKKKKLRHRQTRTHHGVDNAREEHDKKNHNDEHEDHDGKNRKHHVDEATHDEMSEIVVRDDVTISARVRKLTVEGLFGQLSGLWGFGNGAPYKHHRDGPTVAKAKRQERHEFERLQSAAHHVLERGASEINVEKYLKCHVLNRFKLHLVLNEADRCTDLLGRFGGKPNEPNWKISSLMGHDRDMVDFQSNYLYPWWSCAHMGKLNKGRLDSLNVPKLVPATKRDLSQGYTRYQREMVFAFWLERHLGTEANDYFVFRNFDNYHHEEHGLLENVKTVILNSRVHPHWYAVRRNEHCPLP